jgi:cysteine sulfinate desulfinase/cysteine desulfurase-like protein
MGYNTKTARSALRLSLSSYNTEKEVDTIIEKMPLLLAALQSKNNQI